MPEKPTSINLLPQNGDTFLSQALDWALTIGRLLIILIEMLALGTFLYRFTLDMQLVDLHDKIKSESFIIANFQNAENTFRDIQARLTAVKQYITVENTTENIFTRIINMGQGKVTFKDIIVSTQTVTITLQAPTGAAITEFINELKNDSSVTSVVVDKVDNDPTNAAITVNLTAALKPAAFAPANSQDDTSGTDTQSTITTQ